MYQEDFSNINVITRLYYYLFYKLYRWYEKGPSIWMSDWKASLSIDVLVFFVILSFIVYYTTFIDRYFELGDSKIIVFLFIVGISVPNYFIFHHRDQWKGIVQRFDKIPKRKNLIGGWIVFGVVLLIIANLIFAFYQMSLVDWSKYR
jgi:hypothetical protein